MLKPTTRTVLLTLCTAVLLAQSGAGIKWTTPKRWTAQPDRPMRLATYKVPAAAGDSEAGECIVSFFGTGQGGTVEANLDRWKGQFQTAGGQPIANPKIEKQTVGGVKVTSIDLSGTYTATGGMMTQPQAPKANYRMLGAIVEAKQGSVFFKLAGPKKTIAAAEAEYQTMLKSIKSE